MKHFDIKRFTQTFCRLMLIRQRMYIRFFIGLTLCCSLVSIFSFNPFDLEAVSADSMAVRLFPVSSFIIFVLMSILVLAGAFIISDLKHKQDRIGELVLPATNLEKFTARILGSSVVIIAVSFAAIVVGDLLQQGVNMLLHEGSHMSYLKILYKMLFREERIFDNGNATFSTLFYSYIASYGFYVLGGVFFRKNAWILTTIAGFVLSIGSILLFIAYTYLIYTKTDYVVYMPEGVTTDYYGFLCIGFSLICIALAYRIFVRLQAVNNKWVNL